MHIYCFILTILLSSVYSYVNGQQVTMHIKNVSIDYDVDDRQLIFDMLNIIHFNQPRVKLEMEISNKTNEIIIFSTDHSLLTSGNIEYDLNGETISIASAGILLVDEPISEPYVNISPDSSFHFSLVFEPLPSKCFSIKNYRENFFSIIPSLKVTIQQDKPYPNKWVSDPIEWKKILIIGSENKNL